MLFIDPITPIMAYKEAGLLILACGLFITNYLQNRAIKDNLEANANFPTTSHEEHVEQSAKLSEAFKDIEQRLQSLREEVSSLVEIQQQILLSQTSITKNQEVLANNQLHITQGLQQVIDRLIGIVGRE